MFACDTQIRTIIPQETINFTMLALKSCTKIVVLLIYSYNRYKTPSMKYKTKKIEIIYVDQIHFRLARAVLEIMLAQSSIASDELERIIIPSILNFMNTSSDFIDKKVILLLQHIVVCGKNLHKGNAEMPSYNAFAKHMKCVWVCRITKWRLKLGGIFHNHINRYQQDCCEKRVS